MGKGRSNNAGKSNQISMIHLISLNKVNRQKRRRIRKGSLYEESSFLDILMFQHNRLSVQSNSHTCKA